MAASFDARGVTKRFGGLTALQTVDFALESGIASIIGPTGAGTTTLFNIFTGLYPADEGSVTFRGRALFGLRPDQITALGICRTFQNIRLFANMTVIENVLVGMNSRIALGLWDVLSHGPRFARTEADLSTRAVALLDRVGLQANANDVARNLPYGDQRRLELARALGSEPTLLLFDEPTAGMTQGEAGALMRLLRGLVAELGLAIILIEHNMRVVMGGPTGGACWTTGRRSPKGPRARARATRGASRPTWARAAPVQRGRAVLRVDSLDVAYGEIRALKGVGLEVGRGEIVTILGNNGAGKTTTLKTISGLLRPLRGTITLEADPLVGVPPHEIVRRGVAHVPEGRRIFNRLTVRENLMMGAYRRTDGGIAADLERVFTLFPRLKERRTQVAGTLSGGEQQMLAIARALMANPMLLLLDEPSMRLAPVPVA